MSERGEKDEWWFEKKNVGLAKQEINEKNLDLKSIAQIKSKKVAPDKQKCCWANNLGGPFCKKPACF